MLQNRRRRYLLGVHTVEQTDKGWQFCQSGREREKGRGPNPTLRLRA